MGATMRSYLHDIGRQLHLDPNSETEILRELQTHVQDMTQELTDQGVSQDEAIERAMQKLGKPKRLAQEMYDVHSGASWKDTIVGVLPHILFSLLFAFHLWTRVGLVVALLMVTAFVSLRGWKNGRPSWTYPWLGYSLLAPVVSGVLALVTLGYGAWSLIINGTLPLGIPIYLASLIYIPFSLWIVVSILRNVIRRDWLLASLTTFPFPFLVYWLLYLNSRGKVLESGGASLKDADANTALVFLLLAISTAIFFRIGKRLLRGALLVLTTPPVIIMAWLNYQWGPGYLVIFVYAIVSVILLLIPALLEPRIDRYKEWKLLPEDNH